MNPERCICLIFLVLSCWMSVLLLGGVPSSAALASPQEEGSEEQGPEEDLAEIRKYLETISSLQQQGLGEPDPLTGLNSKMLAVHDMYLYEMARAYVELASSDAKPGALVKALKKKHKKAKKLKGKYGLRVIWEADTSERFFFVEDELAKMFTIDQAEKKIKAEFIDAKPELEFKKWKLLETATKKKSVRKLAAFSKLQFIIVLNPRGGKDARKRIGIHLRGPGCIGGKDIMGNPRPGRVDQKKRTIEIENWSESLPWESWSGFEPESWKIPPVPASFQKVLDTL